MDTLIAAQNSTKRLLWHTRASGRQARALSLAAPRPQAVADVLAALTTAAPAAGLGARMRVPNRRGPPQWLTALEIAMNSFQVCSPPALARVR